MGTERGIEVRGVFKEYGSGAARVEALRGINLTIQPGEFVAITGPSGCGKSTLLHLLAGLDVPTTGTILTYGTNLGTLDEDDRATFRGRNVGVVFQAFNLLDVLTAEENVALPLVLANVSSREATHRARGAMERVGLVSRGGHFPAELSGGEQQRVALARAIVADPPLVVADEPTGSLDSANAVMVFDLLRAVADGSQRTVLVVTHDHSLAARADRIVRLQDGTMIPNSP